MAIAPFLAMTAAEICAASSLPPGIAWMACHFSPYGLGLSNLPKELPPGSLLMVDDITPPRRHDPRLIAQQLSECVETLRCHGILLDFQRENCLKTQSIANNLVAALPCPVAVSAHYANDLACPVILPPVPPSVPLETHIAPWKGREIWLELESAGQIITLTKKGAEVCSLPYPDLKKPGFADSELHCHYTIETTEKSAGFTLWRTNEDLEQLLKQAETLGITQAVGLFQEFAK